MSEVRLIDANELYSTEKLLDTDIIRASKEASFLLDQVLYDISAAPTIEPIVHCRDCTNWERHTEEDATRGGCYSAGKPLPNSATHQDHFCSYGNRRIEQET